MGSKVDNHCTNKRISSVLCDAHLLSSHCPPDKVPTLIKIVIEASECFALAKGRKNKMTFENFT